MTMTDPDETRSQYAREDNLATRESAWQPTADGRDPSSEALAAFVTARPRSILEVGCGTGGFAARLNAALPEARVVAIDQSMRFIDLTSARGVEARVADVMALPFADEEFDAVAAMWMLYHVPDLELGLAEIRRVLKPGGLFVAVTNGDEHTAELRRDAGGEALITQFSSENGQPILERHFEEVRRTDLAPRAVFPDHAAAMAYLESGNKATDWTLPQFDGPREYAGAVTVFVCR